jgi:hypothetical protein
VVRADGRNLSRALVAAGGTVLALVTALATLAVTLQTSAANEPSGTIVTARAPLYASGMMPEVVVQAKRPDGLMEEIVAKPERPAVVELAVLHHRRVFGIGRETES